jgi:serine/threonine protein kinase
VLLTIAAGSRLGPYEVLAPLGAGGMGEVYRARDARLNRDVAIKVLPASLSRDRDRLRRFEQEARAAGVLNHPNITAVYDVGTYEGAPYLVSELLEGETLRERLAGGALPVRKAIDFGLQIAHGLAAAHEKGIVHRDLKPENLFITKDGRVKILDFGLAKLIHPEKPGVSLTEIPTQTARTEPGVVMGTVGYMSPEQVRGQQADARSDIFSFGSVLYEMLTGERAFQGESAAETMAAIAQKDPPELAEPSGRFPPAVERILRHCFEKRPEERFDTAHDLAFALETAIGGPSAPQSVVAPHTGRGLAWRAAGVFGLLAAVGVGLLLGGRHSPSPPRFRRLTYHRGYIESARFSPDGQTVVFGSTRRDQPLRVYSTRLDSIESQALELPAETTVLGISRTGEMALLLKCVHHGSWIRKGTLARAFLGGGAPREILEDVTDADISPDGKDLAVAREVGGRQRLEFPLEKKILETDGWMSHPRISPDGKRLAFLDHPIYGNDAGYVALADDSGHVQRLSAEAEGLQGLAWSPDGKEIWFTGAVEAPETAGSGLRYQLWALRPGGKPRLVYDPPMNLRISDISAAGAVLLCGEDSRGEIGGLLRGDAKERDLSTWSDEAIGGISEDGAAYVGVEQSAPGAGIEPVLYYRRVDDPAPVRLGNGAGIGISPDGRWVVNLQLSARSPHRLTLLPTGPGEPRPFELGKVVPRSPVHNNTQWSADGRRLLFSGFEQGHLPRMWLLDLAAGGLPRAVTPEGSSAGVLSPDGQSVATVGEKSLFLYRVTGGSPIEVNGTLPGELPLQWESTGKAIFLWDRAWPARIFSLEIGTGRRTLWKEIAPDPVGLVYGNLQLTRDGQHYVYRLRRITSDLNLAQGLR